MLQTLSNLSGICQELVGKGVCKVFGTNFLPSIVLPRTLNTLGKDIVNINIYESILHRSPETKNE
jgi:hypothetical protein